jgi:hypothetical protein
MVLQNNAVKNDCGPHYGQCHKFQKAKYVVKKTKFDFQTSFLTKINKIPLK